MVGWYNTECKQLACKINFLVIFLLNVEVNDKNYFFTKATFTKSKIKDSFSNENIISVENGTFLRLNLPQGIIIVVFSEN